MSTIFWPWKNLGSKKLDHDNCPHTKLLQLCRHQLCGNLQLISEIFEKDPCCSRAGCCAAPTVYLAPAPAAVAVVSSLRLLSARGSSSAAVWPPPHYRGDCGFPSWYSQTPRRGTGEKALLVFLTLFLFSLFPPQVSDLFSTGFFGTPVQVTGVLASWFLNQIFMPRWFPTFRWILTQNGSQFLPHHSSGTPRLVWILGWRSLPR